MKKLAQINRLEVIDHTSSNTDLGRAYVKWVKEDFRVDVDFQDDGRTLKICLSDLPQP